ncbi:hypothetical protein V6Z11_A05G256700 [Gossypium hirsutum]
MRWTTGGLFFFCKRKIVTQILEIKTDTKTKKEKEGSRGLVLFFFFPFFFFLFSAYLVFFHIYSLFFFPFLFSRKPFFNKQT